MPPERVLPGKKQQRKLARLVDAANRLAEQGAAQQAVEAAVKALELDEDSVAAYRVIVRIQAQHRNHEPARWAAGEALKRAPRSTDVLFDAAKVERIAGDLNAALAHAEAAFAIDAHLPALAGFIVHLLLLLGRREEARQRLEPALAAAPDDVALGLVFGEMAPRLGRVEEAIRRLERHRDAAPAPSGTRRDLLFRLGALHEHAGDYDRAFAAFRAAHAELPYRWDADAYDHAVDEVCSNWSADFLRAAPRATADASHLVFIVGMPRSGTSLVEQILAAHPQVAAGGELPHLAVAAHQASPTPGDVIPFRRYTGALREPVVTALGRHYLDAVAGLAVNAVRVTDKMPANHALLGLVALALPGARVIHCRRDPRDTCVSCYTTPLWDSLQYVGDLSHLGRYARAEAKLMAHWKAVLTLPIHTVDYEALVAEPERESRALIAFAGLSWDDACLRPHEAKRFVDTASAMQVREPVYASSVARWRRYERHLGPLLAALRI